MKKLGLLSKIFLFTRRSLIAVICLSIIFSLPFFVAIISSAFVDLCNGEARSIYGRFDNIIYGYSVEELVVDENPAVNPADFVDYYGEIRVISSDSNLVIGSVDENAIELGNIHLVKGRFPDNDGEICLCESVYYESFYDHDIGGKVIIKGQEYILSGIINDYSVAWNKPIQNDSIKYPDAIIRNLNETEPETIVTLVKNQYPFPEYLYENNRYLIANTNAIEGNSGGKYNAPDFVYMALYVSVILVIVYTMSFTRRRDDVNSQILQCLGVSYSTMKPFVALKQLLLPVAAVFVGQNAGKLMAGIFLKAYSSKSFVSVIYPTNVNLEYHLIICLGICVLTTIIYIVVNHKEIAKKKNGRSSMASRKIKGIIFKELIGDHKSIIISSAVVAVMLLSTVILGLYLRMYIAAKGDVFGKMPIDYDYQFVTNQNVEDYSYVDSKGKTVSVIGIPEDDTIYYMPDHSNIISEEIISDMAAEEEISRVDNYIEANDVYLCIDKKDLNTEYLSGFPVDQVISNEVGEIINVNTDNEVYRNSQFCGFPENEIILLDQYVREGTVDVEKINSAEEIILVVPVYEKIDLGDGAWGLNFIEYDDYSDSSNQYSDHTFNVGDYVELLQILPKDVRLMGNLNAAQVQNDVDAINHTIRIGAIVYERVMWFEDASQMPTAYTFIGTEQTFENLGIKPTFSRTQLFLNEGINYREFEPVIHKYQHELQNFIYENNAAELEEYRQFMVLLKGICYLLISLSICLMMIISATETYIAFSKRRAHYALLRIIGMPPSKYMKLILWKILLTTILSVVIFLIGGIYLVNMIFGNTQEVTTYLGSIRLALYIICPLCLVMGIIVVIYSPMLNKYVVKYCNLY